MKVPNGSPIIPSEPRISPLPTFHTNEARALTQISFSSQYRRSMSNLKTLSSLSSLDVLRKYTRNNSSPLQSTCTCPHILIADDDPFQHLYYQGLFQKALKSEGINLKTEDLCLRSCFSGEELIEKLNKVVECGCGTTKLVVIDYQMGEKKMNGVQTSVKVRQDGFKGHVLLRTSETEDNLKKNHENLEQLLKENVINVLVNKNDSTFGKKFIHKLVSEEIRVL